MTPQHIILFFSLVPLAGVGLYVIFRCGRHYCAHNDPLCRRDRPCIACYREIFSKAEEARQARIRAQSAGQSR